MERLTDEQISEGRRLCAEATPGPWTQEISFDAEEGEEVPDLSIRGPEYEQEWNGEKNIVSDCVCVLGFSAHHRHQNNLKFILWAGNHGDAALEELEALRKENANLRTVADTLREENRQQLAALKEAQREEEGLRNAIRKLSPLAGKAAFFTGFPDAQIVDIGVTLGTLKAVDVALSLLEAGKPEAQELPHTFHCKGSSCRLSARWMTKTVDGYFRCPGCKWVYDAAGNVVEPASTPEAPKCGDGE